MELVIPPRAHPPKRPLADTPTGDRGEHSNAASLLSSGDLDLSTTAPTSPFGGNLFLAILQIGSTYQQHPTLEAWEDCPRWREGWLLRLEAVQCVIDNWDNLFWLTKILGASNLTSCGSWDLALRAHSASSLCLKLPTDTVGASITPSHYRTVLLSGWPTTDDQPTTPAGLLEAAVCASLASSSLIVLGCSSPPRQTGTLLGSLQLLTDLVVEHPKSTGVCVLLRSERGFHPVFPPDHKHPTQKKPKSSEENLSDVLELAISCGLQGVWGSRAIRAQGLATFPPTTAASLPPPPSQNIQQSPPPQVTALPLLLSPHPPVSGAKEGDEVMIDGRFTTGEGGRGRVTKTHSDGSYDIKLHVGGSLRGAPSICVSLATPTHTRGTLRGARRSGQITHAALDSDDVTNFSLWDYVVPLPIALIIDSLLNTTRVAESTPAIFTARDLFLTRGPNTRMLRPRIRALFACPSTHGVIIRFKQQPLMRITLLQAGERALVASRNIATEELLGGFETWGPPVPLGRGGHSIVHFPQTKGWETKGRPQEHDTTYGGLSLIWLGNSSRGLPGIAKTRQPNAGLFAPGTLQGPTGEYSSTGIEWATRGALPKTPILCLTAQRNTDDPSSTLPAIRSGQEILWDYEWQPTTLTPPSAHPTLPSNFNHDTPTQIPAPVAFAQAQTEPPPKKVQLLPPQEPRPTPPDATIDLSAEAETTPPAGVHTQPSAPGTFHGDQFHTLPSGYSKQLEFLSHLAAITP